jgi:hypothetical protein
MWHVWGRRATQARVLWRNLKNREYLQDNGVNVRIILKCILKQWAGKTSNTLISIRIKTHGGLLEIR